MVASSKELTCDSFSFFQVAHSHVIHDLQEYRELIQNHDQLVLKLEHAQVKITEFLSAHGFESRMIETWRSFLYSIYITHSKENIGKLSAWLPCTDLSAYRKKLLGSLRGLVTQAQICICLTELNFQNTIILSVFFILPRRKRTWQLAGQTVVPFSFRPTRMLCAYRNTVIYCITVQ